MARGASGPGQLTCCLLLAACASAGLSARLRDYRYCINQGDSLRSIAARLSSDSLRHPHLPAPHWSLIWSLNHGLVDPDHLKQGQEIRLGLIYSARASDTWELVSSRFGIGMTALAQLNPELVNLPSWCATPLAGPLASRPPPALLPCCCAILMGKRATAGHPSPRC